jgi:hypothetical protein
MDGFGVNQDLGMESGASSEFCRANPVHVAVRLLRTQGESPYEASEVHTKATRGEAVGA